MPNTRLDDLSPNARDLTAASLEWSDTHWDADHALLAFTYGRRRGDERKVLIVRNSIWYALGLFLRNQEADVENACRTVHAVLDNQFHEPGTPYHGTFYRWVGEPHPPADAVMWKDYDPNWRQFIGLALAMILDEYRDRLPESLAERIDRAIQEAVSGEPEGRCPPSYTNIALMKAGLMVWAGHRYDNPEWVEKGEAFGQAVHELFKAHNTFAEYNSPTYYGVNFYALGFWRNYAPSQNLREMGAHMEAELWRDVARYYHAGLKNIAGPYTRSYGMDMTNYSALVGLYIWLAVGRDLAPFPEDGSGGISTEFCYGPAFGLLDVDMPEDALPHFKTFSGERLVECAISTTPKRTATAWIGETLLLGAESTALAGLPADIFTKLSDQFHPATMHWKTPSGEIGWMRLRHMGPVDARAAQNHLTVSGAILDELEAAHPDAHRSFTFQFSASDIDPDKLTCNRWELPGLVVDVETDLKDATVTRTNAHTEIRYTVPASEKSATFALSITP